MSTPNDMAESVVTIVEQLLGMPGSKKLEELRKIKSKNPTLHALVVKRLQEVRNL